MASLVFDETLRVYWAKLSTPVDSRVTGSSPAARPFTDMM